MFLLSLHVWESEVKVAKPEQAPPLAAAGPGPRLPPGPGHTPLPRPPGPGASHTTVLIRLIGLDLELPTVPLLPGPPPGPA